MTTRSTTTIVYPESDGMPLPVQRKSTLVLRQPKLAWLDSRPSFAD